MIYLNLSICVFQNNVLFVAAKPKMKSHYRGHKMALWLHLIPQLHNPNEVDFTNHHHQFNETDLYNIFGKRFIMIGEP